MSDQREVLEVDVVLVGAGPAGLSTAFHLARLIRDYNRGIDDGGVLGERLSPTILVLEKSREVGGHALSGAVVDPIAFNELLSGTDEEPPPYDCPVRHDEVCFLTESGGMRLPLTPPPLNNHGLQVASLGVLVRWLSERCESLGVDVYPGFPAVELLVEEGKVVGVRTGDSGIDREGNQKANFEPGIEVRAKVTVLGEGPRGTLAGRAFSLLGLREKCQPQIYAVGVKELWQSSGGVDPGAVLHTLGYPLDRSDFGGGFLYTLSEGVMALGFVVGLDSPNPGTDPHRLLQRWKSHPSIRSRLDGAKLLSYGAKAIPEGGFWAIPRLWADGLIIIGDSAGFLNSQRLKGIHLAVKSGMLAAETIFDALRADDFSRECLSSYSARFEESWAFKELHSVRNFRQAFQGGFWAGLGHAAIQMVTAGRGIRDPFPIEEGYRRMGAPADPVEEPPLVPDGVITFDRMTSVFHADTSHEEDQPSHLKILDPSVCISRCGEEFGHPCIHFCPAGVYEFQGDGPESRLQVNFSNCVHCKACEISDPYQVILWTPPEGGGGPNWKKM